MCGVSFLGPQDAIEQKSWIMALKTLCLLILSPFVGHTEAWCPKTSIECIWQAEQRWSWLKMGISSHLFIQIDHSKQENLFCWEGRALIHALACGMEHASNLALFRELDSTWSLWKHSESMWWERSCWLEGHDELTRQWSVWTSELKRDIYCTSDV